MAFLNHLQAENDKDVALMVVGNHLHTPHHLHQPHHLHTPHSRHKLHHTIKLGEVAVVVKATDLPLKLNSE